MSTRTTGVWEAFARKALVPVCVLSGVFVVAGFFFPSFVGRVVSGQGWLVAALAFFGSWLAYLALLPLGEESDVEPGQGSAYLLRVRRMSIRRTIPRTVRRFLGRQDPVIFGVPVAVFVGFFAAWFLAPGPTGAAVSAVRGVLLRDLAPLFLVTMLLCVLYAMALVFGPWGEIRLGGPDAEPTYTYPTYFAMIFTAGIAAGIVFWGPAESLFHYATPPPLVEAPPRSGGAIVGALTYALFHWGFSAWSAYLVIGLPIAYFTYQRGAPLRVSTVLAPFLGVENLDGAWARLVDTLAVFATIGGLATSIAFVSRQFLAGIDYQWGVEVGPLAPVLFVGGLTLIYVVSAESGVARGIRRIAGVTVVLFGVFALLLVAVGPRGFVAEQGTAAVARYARDFVAMSLLVGGDWGASWTVWYWSWWFSWAPFAGLFLAALSRGRTVRTVVLTGVGATSAATAVWFLLFGGTSLFVQHAGVADVLGVVAANDGSVAVAGFPILGALPLGQLLVFCFLALIVGFIVTSADTSTLVVAVLATRRARVPTTGSIVFWGIFQGLIAVAVLVVGGGETLEAVSVLTGGPFAVIALVALVGLSIVFYRDERGHPSPLDRLRDRLGDRELKAPNEVLREDDRPPEDD